ncbi:VOC family protein [Fulvivirgaceae bacterium BMA10]|uniref:VOC family protein n=1 Tax=Splendidivirga corallicola TaxID=3051826 RepID=A0ABT8KXN8_9BACT|nr:VOC family protein [Fulvivirgaceae bacterium BMA10]
MKNTDNNPAPAGCSTVCPYLMVDSVEKELEFLKNVFSAEITEELNQQDGSAMHGEARIGDTTIMMGKSREEYPARESMNYVYVNDVDETFEKGLQNGATSLMQPVDQFYGNREAGLRDSQGNQWWIAQVIETLTPEEMQKRLSDSEK